MSVFGFESQHEQVPAPHRDHRRHRRRRAAGRLGALVVALVVLLGGGAYAITQLRGGPPKDYPGPGVGRTYVQVSAGDTATDIGRALLRAGVVASVGAFKNAAERDPRSVGIEAGYYALARRMRAAAALTVLENPADLIRSKLVVPEGTPIKELLPIIGRETTVAPAAVQAVLADPAQLHLPGYAQGQVVGFLFPATYQVPPDTTAVQLLQMMVDRFDQTAANIGLLAGAVALHATPLQVVTIASILERESAGPADDGKVARVFYNRIAAGMPLGSEFTYAYAGGDPANPYNTYTHKGYPPGAYDSPGEATLTAALHPSPGPWKFFVTLPDHTTLFASTDAGFLAARHTCLSMGGCRG